MTFMATMRWNWICWGTAARSCSLSSPTRTIRFNFVVSIMYTQLFNLLCDRADDQCGGQLKYHVRLLLDEFANIGLIPKFDKLIATIRSREISASIILQSQSQLKTIYKDAAETIIGNCDTMLFLGGKESSTLKEISETLGKETIDLYNTSDTRGQSPSFGTTYQKTGKERLYCWGESGRTACRRPSAGARGFLRHEHQGRDLR